MDTKIKIAIADSHVLLRNALVTLIWRFEECQVVYDVNTGQELIEKMQAGPAADIVILDFPITEMDGYSTASWMQQHFPQTHVLILTQYDSEIALIRLLQAGVKGFLRKSIYPDELRFAIKSVMQCGYYYSDHTIGKLVGMFMNKTDNLNYFKKRILSDTEFKFLQLACSDLTYKEIAALMKVNPRVIDTLRDQMFVKLDVRSRTGLALQAIRHGIVGI